MRRSGAVRCSSLVTEGSALQQGLWVFHQTEPTGALQEPQNGRRRTHTDEGGATLWSATKAVHGTCVPSGMSLATRPPAQSANPAGTGTSEDRWEDSFSHLSETLSKTTTRGRTIYTTSRQTRQHGGRKKYKQEEEAGIRVLRTKLGIVGRFWSSCYRFK